MTPQMMKTTFNLNGKRSFRLVPLTNDCPYVECVFEINDRLLRLVTKERFDTFRMIESIDENGMQRTNKKGKCWERRPTVTNYDMILSEREDVQKFVDLFTGSKVNLDEYYTVEETKKDGPVQPEDLTSIPKGKQQDLNLKKLPVVEDDNCNQQSPSQEPPIPDGQTPLSGPGELAPEISPSKSEPKG